MVRFKGTPRMAAAKLDRGRREDDSAELAALLDAAWWAFVGYPSYRVCEFGLVPKQRFLLDNSGCRIGLDQVQKRAPNSVLMLSSFGVRASQLGNSRTSIGELYVIEALGLAPCVAFGRTLSFCELSNFPICRVSSLRCGTLY
ncbi:hypothetical protein PIB30_063986 [Stylosanthes scabra]|uniref:Uncharacterized protein n=1 Tax=Stylosanthes scabra TaxID=79078 RepID=A0ABU6TM90_9FABA|nr:hypothetical protein [Stylosanthes scabra]